MIYFGVPLRSKVASKDWNSVTRAFNRTLESIYRQTDSSFKILVACHDIPELNMEYDNRVEFLVSDQPYPTTYREMMLDKGWKVSMIAKRIRKLGGGYTMLVDSDDIVSNRIAAYVYSHPGENGFLSRFGYVYCDGFDYMKKILYPHRICGSFSIVNYTLEDLPEEMPKDLWDNSPKDRWIIRKSHREVPDYLAQSGRKLKEIPFPTTIYVRNTGDNHSMLGGSDLNLKRKLEIFLRKKVELNGDVGFEFGFIKNI